MADSLKVGLNARVKLVKNTTKVLFDQLFQPVDADYTLHAGQSLAINASGSSTLNFGSIVTVRHLVLQVDRSANLKINASATAVPLNANGVFFAANASLTSIKVINNSATYTLTVNYLGTD